MHLWHKTSGFIYAGCKENGSPPLVTTHFINSAISWKHIKILTNAQLVMLINKVNNTRHFIIEHYFQKYLQVHI